MSCFKLIRSIKNFVLKTCGKRINKNGKEASLRDTIEELIEEDEGSEIQSIAESEKEILGNVLDLQDIQVQGIMAPKVEIVASSIKSKIENLISLFIKCQKSSILIYKETMDDIIGVVYLKDIINCLNSKKSFKPYIKEILFVPPTMRSLDLILKMRDTGIKLAIVVDEYGGVDGIVSFRDLMEEIIGDIKDVAEMKQQESKVIKGSDGSVIADARTTFDEIEKYGAVKLFAKDKSIETLGGMIFSISGKIPVKGELISFPEQNLEFEILDADPRKIKSVRIRKKA